MRRGGGMMRAEGVDVVACCVTTASERAAGEGLRGDGRRHGDVADGGRGRIYRPEPKYLEWTWNGWSRTFAWGGGEERNSTHCAGLERMMAGVLWGRGKEQNSTHWSESWSGKRNIADLVG